MDQLPPDTPANPEQQAASSPTPKDLVAAQIRQQLKGEDAPPVPPKTGPERPASADPGFAFQMRMRAGGNEMNDTAEKFKAEHGGEEYQPPAFDDRGWEGSNAAGTGGGGALKVLVGVLVIAALGAAVWLWGVPAWQAHQQQGGASTSGGGVSAKAGKAPLLDAVTLDDAFDASLRTALTAGNAAWKQAGLDAYVYRYNVDETRAENVSQTITVNATLGGKDAAKGARDGRAAFDQATAQFVSGLTAHPGVAVQFDLLEADPDSTPGDNDKYLLYGYDYGLEHMSELKPVIDALEDLKRDQHSYPRALSDTLVQPKLRTSGGIRFMPRGFGYLPLYETDSAGNIQMGEGTGTLDRMTPKAITGYYLFLYLGDEGQGLDVYTPSDLDYYMRKVAPLPYDTNGAKLHNMTLKPDGQPDGIGCIVKNGKLLRAGES
jgi:hypothetical protein